MINGPILRLTVILGIFAFIVIVNANGRQVFAQSCDTVTDQQLVTDIYARINTDKSLASQISHMNVVAIYKVVKLQGWTNSQMDFDKALDFVYGNNCVRMINTSLFQPAPPTSDSPMRSANGCSSGTKVLRGHLHSGWRRLRYYVYC